MSKHSESQSSQNSDHEQNTIRLHTDKSKLETILQKGSKIVPFMQRNQLISIFKEYYENQSIFFDKLQRQAKNKQNEIQNEEGWITAGNKNNTTTKTKKKSELAKQQKKQSYNYLEDTKVLKKVNQQYKKTQNNNEQYKSRDTNKGYKKYQNYEKNGSNSYKRIQSNKNIKNSKKYVEKLSNQNQGSKNSITSQKSIDIKPKSEEIQIKSQQSIIQSPIILESATKVDNVDNIVTQKKNNQQSNLLNTQQNSNQIAKQQKNDIECQKKQLVTANLINDTFQKHCKENSYILDWIKPVSIGSQKIEYFFNKKSSEIKKVKIRVVVNIQ